MDLDYFIFYFGWPAIMRLSGSAKGIAVSKVLREKTSSNLLLRGFSRLNKVKN